MPSDNLREAVSTGATLPQFDHILDLLDYKSAHVPDETAITLVVDGSGSRETIDWRTLAGNARRAAGCYRSRGLNSGDRVLIMLPTGAAFLAAFLGALGAGLTPTSIAPFTKHNGAYSLDEWRALVASLTPALMVGETIPDGIDLALITPAELLAGDEIALAADPTAPCYVQLSSGSTGIPKGIVLSWPSVKANLLAIAERIPLTPLDHMFSWLPMYHDMGLFGTLLAPLLAGSRVTLMDPKLFVSHPMLWLQAVAASGSTITTTPPSALHFCLQTLKRRPLASLDLSKLQKVICGSEPVTASLIRDFEAVLSNYGVAATVLKPVYGLAENTLAVTIPHLQQSPRIERVEKAAFETLGEIRPCSADAESGYLEMVCVGPLLSGVKLEIRDAENQVLGENKVGAIWLDTPSLLSGTLSKTGEVLPHSGWYDTGDSGYMEQGGLFITGRRRDIIIKNGRNYSPERVEELATLPAEAYRAAAFGVFQDALQSEKVIVLIEVRKAHLSDAVQRDKIRLAVRSGFNEAGYPVDEIKLVDKGSLPRTSSGKIRRQACRLAYINGTLDSLTAPADSDQDN